MGFLELSEESGVS